MAGDDEMKSSMSVDGSALGVVTEETMGPPSSMMVVLLGPSSGGATPSPRLESEAMLLFRPGRLPFKAQIQLALSREAW